MRKRLSLGLSIAALVAGSLLLAEAAFAVLDGEKKLTVKLKDGTDVVLFGEYRSKISKPTDGGYIAPFQHRRPLTAAMMKTRGVGSIEGAFRKEVEPPVETRAGELKYYYLPPSIHLSMRPDGTPEFLFVRYTTDAKAEAGGTQGGLMHMLMDWGLTPAQEQELRGLVKSRTDGAGVLAGAADLVEGDEKSSFKIISGTLSDSGMTKSLVQSGHAPLLPGGKIAAAANLSANGAQLFLATLEKARSIADLSVELDFAYDVMLPAARGKITFDWSKMQTIQENEHRSATSTESCDDWFLWCWDEEETYTETQMEEFFNDMKENQVIVMEFEGMQPDNKYVGAVLEAMLDFFKDSLTDEDEGEELALPDSKKEDGGEKEDLRKTMQDEDIRSYTLNRTKIQQLTASKKKVIYLDAGLAVRKRFTVVGNLASWYNGVKDNPRCVQAVNLNDPFFQHRDIRFILDLEAKEIFDQLVNYVTVNVKKPRSSMAEFNDSLTIDAEYLKTKGVAAAVSYARGEDKNSEVYMYQTQWSLKGGNIFPANARWLRGNWEGVTLAPPVERWTVEAEGDLDLMTSSDIARVSLELHYPLFGEEKFTTIALSPREGQPLKAMPIFVDRGTKGFAYRTIVHHKTEGRMIVPCIEGLAGRCQNGWRVGIGERYVYANIPEQILVAGSPREQAKQAAKQLGELGAEKILNQFEELFAGGN